MKCRSAISVGNTAVPSAPRAALSDAIASACSSVLRQQLVELLPAALVELERRARDDDLRVLEHAGVGRLGEIAHEVLDRLARELATQAGRQRPPLILVEVRARGGAIEVLEGAAPRLGAYEFDAVVVAQHSNVVADDPERSAELHG